MLKIVDGLFTSKINYGLQLYGPVRTSNEDPFNTELNSLQIIQNKMARFLNNKTLHDKICNIKLFENINMLSVNQLNEKIKIQEIWKSSSRGGLVVEQWINNSLLSGTVDQIPLGAAIYIWKF